MFKKLKNKIQNELDKEQSSTNVSMCSSMSSSKADLTLEDQNLHNNQKLQVLDTLTRLDIEEEDDSEEIVQKFRKPIKSNNDANNLMSFNENHKTKEHEQVLDDLLIKVENSINKIQESSSINQETTNENDLKLVTNGSSDEINENQLTKLNDELELKTNEMYELKEKFKKLEQNLKDQMIENKKLENANVTLQNAKHEVNLRNNKLFNKLDEMKKQTKQLQDKIMKQKDENRQLMEKNNELKLMIESMKETIEFEREEKMEIKNEFNKFKLSVQSKTESNKNEKLIDDLKDRITKLEDQIIEKNKTIKLQNQRIHDIKKSVQKGDLFLKDEQINKHHLNNGNFENGFSSSKNGSSTKLDEQIVNGKQQQQNQPSTAMVNEMGKLNNNKDYATHVNDINFKYLQNVVLKFITSNDHESQKHLVKAISTLLKFTNEEEQIIKQSLERKESWFKI